MSKLTIDTPDSGLAASIADDLLTKGLAIPDIDRVLFNFTTKKDKPRLATILFLADGTKVSVVNSDLDKLHLDENGKPSIQDKENGIAHAIAKLVLASKIRGNLAEHDRVTAGYGRIMNDLVAKSYDQQAEKEKQAKQKAEARAAHEKRQAEAKARKRPSLRKCVQELSDVIAILKADLKELQTRANGDELHG